MLNGKSAVSYKLGRLCEELVGSELLSQHLLGETQENQTSLQVRTVGPRPGIEAGNLPRANDYTKGGK
jgi:hypothetical protein